MVREIQVLHRVLYFSSPLLSYMMQDSRAVEKTRDKKKTSAKDIQKQKTTPFHGLSPHCLMQSINPVSLTSAHQLGVTAMFDTASSFNVKDDIGLLNSV